ncbi:STN domain-containing protein [Alcaligenes faecalis]|uniref:STN domain-containing protein n=2 Tax=Alcaligenes faecalis TaxID=511 RepID=UPI0012D64FEE|nr:STN domain-containing protein [Alcaligenes faecalis]KAA1288940.1 hypothetical protein D7S43_02625 [Alcaligenes faecalis]
MPMTQVAISVAALLGCLLVFAFASQAHARSDAETLLHSSERLDFDIPAQPLGDALDAYGRLTQLSVLIVGEPAHYPAPAVHGNLTRKEALAALLHESGMAAYFVDNRSIVVRPPVEQGGAMQSPGALRLTEIPGVHIGDKDYGSYIAHVQYAVRDALCATPRTRPGNYRLAMQLWIDATGHVRRLNLLGSTGHALRDQAIAQTLRGLPVELAPDAAMPQPILMVLLPTSSPARLDCPMPLAG